MQEKVVRQRQCRIRQHKWPKTIGRACKGYVLRRNESAMLCAVQTELGAYQPTTNFREVQLCKSVVKAWGERGRGVRSLRLGSALETRACRLPPGMLTCRGRDHGSATALLTCCPWTIVRRAECVLLRLSSSICCLMVLSSMADRTLVRGLSAPSSSSMRIG